VTQPAERAQNLLISGANALGRHVLRTMFRFDPKLTVAIALIGLVLAPIVHAELLEYWGGKGAGMQVYSDHRAYFLFDCSEGEAANWTPPAAAEGFVRSDKFTEPLRQATSFSAALVTPQILRLTVTVEGREPAVFELRKGQTPDLNNCPLGN